MTGVQTCALPIFGAWVVPVEDAGALVCGPGDSGTAVADLQHALKRYGYGIEANGRYDELTTAVVTAFQRHFRTARVDGLADRGTIDTLHALLAARK